MTTSGSLFPVPETPAADDLRGHLLELYARALLPPVPTEHVIGRFLRLRPDIKGGAKGFLAATLYALLRKRARNRITLAWAGRTEELESIPDPQEEATVALYAWLRVDSRLESTQALSLLQSALVRTAGRAPAEGEPALSWDVDLLLRFAEVFAGRLENDRKLQHAPDAVRQAAQVSLPPDLWSRWLARFGEEEAWPLARSLGQTAPLDLRVNTLKTTAKKLIAFLKSREVEAEPGSFSPQCVRLKRKLQLNRLTGIDEAWFELQDEGSQLVGLAVDPQPGWRVLDACAGGGGKALQLAALAPQATIFAHDLEAARLEPITKRAAQAGATNIEVLAPGTAASQAPYDAVLIDAPCLGLGTARRDPLVVWRGDLQQRLAAITRLQRECIEQYAPLVKPGGVLVYATCSFEPEETTEMVQQLNNHGFRSDPLPPLLCSGKLRNLMSADRSHITLLPSLHGTDGFFIARVTHSKG